MRKPVSLMSKINIFFRLTAEEKTSPELWIVAESMHEHGKELFRVLCKEPENLEFIDHIKICPACEIAFLRYLDKMMELADG